MAEASSEFNLGSRERLTFEGGESVRLDSFHVVGERTKGEKGGRRHVDQDLRMKDLQDILSLRMVSDVTTNERRKTNVVNRSVGAINHRANFGMLHGDSGRLVDRRPKVVYSTLKLSTRNHQPRIRNDEE